MDITIEKKTRIRKYLLVSALTLGMGAFLLTMAGMRIPAAGVLSDKLQKVRSKQHWKQLRSELQTHTSYADAITFIEDSRRWDVVSVVEQGYATQCYVPETVGCVVVDYVWKEVTFGTRCVYIADGDCCCCLVFEEGDWLLQINRVSE